MQNKKAYLWGLLSRFAPQAIYLLTTLVLARFVSPNAFGTIGILAVIFMVANILLDSGLGGSLIKEKNITELDCSTIGVFNIVVSLLIYIVLFFLSGFIQNYFNIDGLSIIVKVICFVFPITAFGIVPLSLLKRNLQFNKIFISSISGVIVASIGSIIIAVNGGDVYALVAYQILVNLVNVVMNFIFSKYKFSLKFSSASLKRLIPFGFFTSVVTIVDALYENIMTLLTGKFLNVQTAGYLYQAKRLEETSSSSAAMAVGIVAFPILTKLKDDLELFRIECSKTFDTITLLVNPLLIVVSIFSTEIIILLFGKQWLLSAPYLKILMLCGVFILAEQLMSSFVKSLGRVRSLMYVTLIKRFIGLAILLLTLVADARLLIYSYLLTTIIGCMINIKLYSSLTKKHFITTFKHFLGNIIPSFVIFYICEIIFSYFPLLLPTRIIITLILLFYYYMIYLRFRGINVFIEIKSFLKNKCH